MRLLLPHHTSASLNVLRFLLAGRLRVGIVFSCLFEDACFDAGTFDFDHTLQPRASKRIERECNFALVRFIGHGVVKVAVVRVILTGAVSAAASRVLQLL